MIKLSDIIKSGGGNAKINRFINKYVLSKKEKKDVISAIKENSDGENQNNFGTDFLYVKNTSDIKDAAGINVFYPFYRGLNKIYPRPGESIETKRVYFTTVDESNYGMHAVEIFKVKDLTCVTIDGITVKLDSTSYNSLIESLVNSYISSGYSEFSKEELITMMKSNVVEITKEEFEVIWNEYNK